MCCFFESIGIYDGWGLCPKLIQYQYSTVFNYDEVAGDKYRLSKEIKGFSPKNMVEQFELDYPTLNKILIKLLTNDQRKKDWIKLRVIEWNNHIMLAMGK